MPDRITTKNRLMQLKSLLVEEWRGIGPSLALANQNLLLELRKLDGLKVYHHDLPNVPLLPDDVSVDCVYRVADPIRPGHVEDRRRTVTFMSTDIGLGQSSFVDGDATSEFYTRGENLIVTPSEWSRHQLLDHGYKAEKVAVVPLGVDIAAFTPLLGVERTLRRAQMGLDPDETVFANAGGPLWNAGIDLLLRAFAVLRLRGRRVRLMLADQHQPTGMSVDEMVHRVGADCPDLLRPETLAAICVIRGALEPRQLRTLYGVADFYVSPYRVQGATASVLEAVACGTRIIVTRGGATDDFCNDDIACLIPGREKAALGIRGRYIEPDLEALISVMDERTPAHDVGAGRYAGARDKILKRFSVAEAALHFAALTVGLERPQATAPDTIGPSDGRMRANSFDVFDTLIARRCVEPWRIFEQVGVKLGRPDFTQARIASEAQLAGRDYTLHDIYQQLAASWTLTPGEAETLQSAEIAAELENVIPIEENMVKLQHGDLLISDMYLPEPIIRALLDAAGLNKRVGLCVSTQGKRSGHIWQEIASHVAIGRHLGDNPVSDLEMPTRFGIASEHTDASAPTLVETWLAQQGLPGLSLFVREARLRTWNEDPAFRDLQKIQVQLNLPILLLSSIQLLRVVRETDADRLLFCSRDCDLWLELFRALAARIGIGIETTYFYTSRIARMKASPDYLSYTRKTLGARGLIVDACGTGWSLSHLFQALGMEGQHGFFIHRSRPVAEFERHAPTPQTCTFHTVIHPDRPILNIGIELINTAEHGSVMDVKIVRGAPVPVLDAPCESSRMQAAISVQREAFLDAVGGLAKFDVSEILDISAEKIAFIVQTLYEYLHTQPALPDVFMTEFRKEILKVHDTLLVAVPLEA
jgi:glycosyltransferase involved in cell wall biosynthesis